MNNAIYTACVTPNMNDGTAEVMIYKSVPAGVCGPFSEKKIVPANEVDKQIEDFGYKRVEDFGPICANQFCEAVIVPAR